MLPGRYCAVLQVVLAVRAGDRSVDRQGLLLHDAQTTGTAEEPTLVCKGIVMTGAGAAEEAEAEGALGASWEIRRFL